MSNMTVVPVAVVLNAVSGMLKESPGATKRGKAGVTTMLSATFIAFSADPNLSPLYANAINRTSPLNSGMVSGPVAQPDPPGVPIRRSESARDMLAAVEAARPADAAIFAAAVADFRPADLGVQKIKKVPSG